MTIEEAVEITKTYYYVDGLHVTYFTLTKQRKRNQK